MSNNNSNKYPPAFLVGCYHNGILRSEIVAIELPDRYYGPDAPPVPDIHTKTLQKMSVEAGCRTRNRDVPLGSGWVQVRLRANSRSAAVSMLRARDPFNKLAEDRGDVDIVVLSDGSTWSDLEYSTTIRLTAEQYADLQNHGKLTELNLRDDQEEESLQHIVNDVKKLRRYVDLDCGHK